MNSASWQSRARTRANLIAAVASTALTSTLFLPFLQEARVLRVQSSPPLQIVQVALPRASVTSPPAKTSTGAARPSSIAPPAVPRRQATVGQSQPELELAAPSPQVAPEPPFVSSLTAPEPSGQASAPMVLDGKVLRTAAQAAKSDARRLAEGSGAYFGDMRPSREEQLASAISRSGKEECLRKGDSLLSVFAIAYEVAAGKCR